MHISEANAHWKMRERIVETVAKVAAEAQVGAIHVEHETITASKVPVLTREQMWPRMLWNQKWTEPDADYPQCWAHDDLFVWFNNRDNFEKFLRYQEDVWWVEYFWHLPEKDPKKKEVLRAVRERHIVPLVDRVSREVGKEVVVESYLSMLDGHGWRKCFGKVPERRAAVRTAEARRRPANPHKKRMKEEGKRIKELRERKRREEKKAKKAEKDEMRVWEPPKRPQNLSMARETERQRIKNKRQEKRRRLREKRQKLIATIEVISKYKFCAMSNDAESVIVPLTAEYTKLIQEKGGGLLNQRWFIWQKEVEGTGRARTDDPYDALPGYSVEVSEPKPKQPKVKCFLCGRVGRNWFKQEDRKWRCKREDKCEDRATFGSKDEREVEEPEKEKVVVRLDRPAVDMTSPLPKKRHKEFKITKTKELKRQQGKITKGR